MHYGAPKETPDKGKRMQVIKHSIKYILTFVITLLCLAGGLVLCAKIPQEAIKPKVQESAVYLCEGKLFGELVKGVEGSKIDRYADSILLAIAYQYDDENPLTSVMWSSYYYSEYRNENQNLLDAVTFGHGPNQQYLRYWHGSNVIVRPLLLFFNIRQIYVLNGVVLAVLAALLLAILVKNKAYVPAMAVVAGLVLTASWFVPFSLEYTWTYLIMLIGSIFGVKLALGNKRKFMGPFFLVGGMITNYMDFLTTETLTLLVPLLLILWLDMHHNTSTSASGLLKKAVSPVFAWGCGYAGMWGMKWIMASVILKENVLPYVSGHIEERLGGDIGVGMWQYVTDAVLNNIKCLFPFEYGGSGLICGGLLLLLVAYIGYVYHKKQVCKERILIYVLLGLVPYIRYIVLHNHSYLHCFFTYRAQIATILAIAFVLEEVTDWRWLIGADTGKRKS